MKGAGITTWAHLASLSDNPEGLRPFRQAIITAFELAETGSIGWGVLNVILSIVTGVLAVWLGTVLGRDQYLALVRALEPCDQPQRRGLAAAGRTQ